MTNEVMQCCYTNACRTSGDHITTGWQTVAVSEGLPAEACRICEKQQGMNSSVQDRARQELGKNQVLFEVFGSEEYVYVMHTQYGLKDFSGRDNLFSHAYIFPWKQAMKNLNLFLGIKSGCFASDEKTAEEQRALEYIKSFDLPGAIHAAGLNSETWRTLIRCVYIQMSEKRIISPLYIKYDGTEQQLRALMYCVYGGLPGFLRKRLKMATSLLNGETEKNVIFSEYTADKEYCFDPQNGENTILTDRMEQKLKRLKFVDYALIHNREEEIFQYYERLSECAAELGDVTCSDEFVLQIAHSILTDENTATMSDERLMISFGDAMAAALYGNCAMERYVDALLKEICNRHFVLTEQNEINLKEYVKHSSNDTFIQRAEDYWLEKIYSLETGEAALELNEVSGELLEKYQRKMRMDERGCEILDHFYALQIMMSLHVSWDLLKQILYRTSDLPKRKNIQEIAEEYAWKLYEEELRRYSEILPKVEAYRNYCGIIKNFPDRMEKDYFLSAREKFWESLSFDQFSFSDAEYYEELRTEQSKCRDFLKLSKISVGISEKSPEEILDLFFETMQSMTEQFSENQIQMITEEVFSQIAEEKRDPGLEKWLFLSAKIKERHQYELLMEIRNDLKKKDYEKIPQHFIKFLRTYEEELSMNDKRKLSEMIVDCAKTDDAAYHPVSLDVWLMTGKYLYENCFEILDQKEPFILEESEEKTADESSLLSRMEFVQEGLDYIKAGGKNGRSVKRWLARKKKENRNKGMFSKWFSKGTKE